MSDERSPPPSDPRLVEAMLRYLDRRCSAGELDALAQQLREDGGRRRQMARLLLMMDHLQGLERGTVPQLVEVRTGARSRALDRPRGGRLAVAGACLALGAAAALLLLVSRRGMEAPVAREQATPVVSLPAQEAPGRRPRPMTLPPLRPEVVAGEVAGVTGAVRLVRDGETRPARAGMTIESGTGIELMAPHAHASLALVDGTRVELEGEAQLLAVEAALPVAGGNSSAVRLLVQRGRLRVTSGADQAGSVRLVTPLSEIVMTGRLRLAVTDEQTRADVRAGTSQVTRLSDAQRVVAAAGASALVTESSALRAVELPRALLVHGGEGKGMALDRRLTAEIEAAGLMVVPMLESDLGPEHLPGKALVVISSSTSSAVLPERLIASGLREAPVPVVTCENASFSVLGLTTRAGSAPMVTDALVEGTGHPLAAGRSGTIRLADRPVDASWGLPAPRAVRIVSLPGRRRVAAFAYEAGVPMVGLPAPARRSICFLDSERVEQVSAAGWELFAAAVRWAAGR